MADTATVPEQPPDATAQAIFANILAMGYDPLSKKNSTGLDYVDKLQNDTYEYINPKQFDLNGRSVFITGASRGIGRATAVSYAKAGASYIAIGARSSLSEVETEILEAAKQAGRAAPTVLALKLDVTDKSSVAQAAVDTEKAFGRCDILINNSGAMERPLSMAEADPDEWWHTFNVNVYGTFLVTRALVPLLLKHADGLKQIVNLTSLYALTVFPGTTAYQMSKLVTLRFSDMINAEYGDQGVLSWSFHPGGVKTDVALTLPEVIHQFLTDTPQLPGDTIVFLTAERREWLAGRYISAQWDMKEFLSRKEKIVKEDHLKMRLAVGRD